ncbi:MAG: hypothetical protein IDH49_08785 [Gammaproteobacteria bacterium]|nr:hypothetical protein [Gammaproteobacteria bacterium]
MFNTEIENRITKTGGLMRGDTPLTDKEIALGLFQAYAATQTSPMYSGDVESRFKRFYELVKDIDTDKEKE